MNKQKEIIMAELTALWFTKLSKVGNKKIDHLAISSFWPTLNSLPLFKYISDALVTLTSLSTAKSLILVFLY